VEEEVADAEWVVVCWVRVKVRCSFPLESVQVVGTFDNTRTDFGHIHLWVFALVCETSKKEIPV